MSIESRDRRAAEALKKLSLGPVIEVEFFKIDDPVMQAVMACNEGRYDVLPDLKWQYELQHPKAASGRGGGNRGAGRKQSNDISRKEFARPLNQTTLPFTVALANALGKSRRQIERYLNGH